MRDDRRVYRVGNSWVIPIPLAVRRHLGVVQGGALTWHVGPQGQAEVTVGLKRIGGKPPGQKLERELAAAERRIALLTRQLQARPAAVLNEGYNAGRMAHMGELIKLGAQLDQVIRRLDELTARIPYRRRGQGPRPVLVAGDVATGGASRRRTRRPRAVVVAGDVSTVGALEARPVVLPAEPSLSSEGETDHGEGQAVETQTESEAGPGSAPAPHVEVDAPPST